MNSIMLEQPSIDCLVREMRDDGCDAVLNCFGDLEFSGSDHEDWQLKLQDRTPELMAYLGSVRPDDQPPVGDSLMRGMMRQHGIGAPWSSKELDDAKIDTQFLVNEVLVSGQPCVIAGASKSMKTSTAIDLAISLASGSPFLGRFLIPAAKRVLLLSAESGEGTIQETSRRVAKSKGLRLPACDSVQWGFWVPRAKDAEHLAILDYQLKESGAEVVVIDPLYQCLAGEDMSNLSMNGRQLQAIVGVCKQRNVTPVLVDHVKRSSTNASYHKPLELSDISGAGKAEFFRQWILLGRRQRFNPEHPFHRLWMTLGGSAGHCNMYALDIDESREATTKGRAWKVCVRSKAIAEAEDAKQRDASGIAKREMAANATLEENMQRVRDVFKPESNDKGWSKRQIRDALTPSLSGDTVNKVLERLVELGEVAVIPAGTVRNSHPRYRRTQPVGQAMNPTSGGTAGTKRDDQ
ncbi:AAA family ATPase [Rosistilla oblonga]|uniref:Uncharacterized protein n=1 Tax=Rosistilla oblonga TaxID=2527990 RepID=A0A518ITR1_9BACT|nr:AAA family ATPase [Rosistilla oblonga]QDV56476.1 hypothetical protein Mal33_24660 [Rosistilla oblonga]